MVFRRVRRWLQQHSLANQSQWRQWYERRVKRKSKRRGMMKLLEMISRLNSSAKEFMPTSRMPASKSLPAFGGCNSLGSGRRSSGSLLAYVSSFQVSSDGRRGCRRNGNHLQYRILDIRICGDPYVVLRSTLVPFANEHGARTALSLGETIIGLFPIKDLSSKTDCYFTNKSNFPSSGGKCALQL